MIGNIISSFQDLRNIVQNLVSPMVTLITAITMVGGSIAFIWRKINKRRREKIMTNLVPLADMYELLDDSNMEAF